MFMLVRFWFAQPSPYICAKFFLKKDQSPAAALKRIQLQLREDAEYLFRGRVRIIK